MVRHRFCAYAFACAFVLNANAAEDADAVEEIVVTASPLGRTTDELLQPADVIAAAELERKRRGTIGETLEQQPGVSTTDFGLGAGRPVIRGQAGPRVEILENGIASMDASDVSADHAVTIDPAQARQVEVLKGPATLLYGGRASAGVVNVVNDRLPTSVIDGLHGSASGYYGDNASDTFGTGAIGYGSGPHMFHVDYAKRDADDYDIPGNARTDGTGTQGELANSAVRVQSGAASYGFIGDAASGAVAVSRFETRYGLPAEETAFIDMNQTRYDVLGLIADPTTWLETLELRAGYTDYDHTEFEGPDEPGTVFENEQTQIRMEAIHAPIAGWRGAFGVQYEYRDFEAIGEEAFVPPVVTRNVGVFLVEERPWSLGKLEFGIRMQRDEQEPDDLDDKSFSPFSFSAGAVFDLGEKSHLKLLATRSERSPASEELYAFGPHLATATFERGADDLGEETANNIEVGLDFHGDRLTWEVNVYYERIEDFIFLSEVDAGLDADGGGTANTDGQADFVDEEGIFDPAGELLLVDYDQEDAEFYGIEAQADFEVMTGPVAVNARVFGDRVIAELDDGGNLPRVTPARLGLGLDVSHGALRANVDLTRVFSKDNLADLETPTDDYDMLTAGLTYRLGSEERGLEIYLEGRNLLDEDARRATSFLKDVAPLPGRAAIVGVRLEI
jgi:iron complex outermembrane receptor protein